MALSGSISRSIPLPRALGVGVIAGLVGGVLFGVLMAMQGMLPMVAALIGADSAAIGFVVHLVISAGAGLAFGAVAAALPSVAATPVRAAAAGAAYGILWWVVGALVAMPTMLGMGEMVLVIGETQIQSLIGHIVFGIATGLVFHLLARRLTATA